MKVIKAYKTELDPNNKQITALKRFAGTARYVFNWGLAEWKRQYETGEKPSAYSLKKQFNSEKDELCPWIREMPYAVTESAFVNLGSAFQHFFRRVKNGKKEVGYPKFKNKHGHQSFQVCNVKVLNDRIRITRIGWVRLKEKGYIPTSDSGLKFGVYATISERAGRWYISILVHDEIPDPVNESVLVIGADFGIESLVVCSDGTVYENPKPLRVAQRNLKRLNKEKARRKRGGSNYKKTLLKLQKQHAKIANIRKHVLHNISHDLVANKRPGVIVIENLNISGMMKNHYLAQAIADVGFYELRRQIEYKAKRCGVQVLLADRWFPSSKTCSNCGHVKNNLKLSNRVFECTNCGLELNRDVNAARNLAALMNRETHGDCLGS